MTNDVSSSLGSDFPTSGRVSTLPSDEFLSQASADVILKESKCCNCEPILSLFAGFLHISIELLKTMALIGEWLHQLFKLMELENYNDEPSKSVQYTWLPLVIIAASFLLNLSVWMFQRCSGKKDEKNTFIEKLFSSSFLFLLITMGVELKIFLPLSLPSFIVINLLSLPWVSLNVALSAPSLNRYTCPWSKNFKLPCYPDVSVGERLLNMGYSVKQSFFAMIVFFSALNRTFYNASVEPSVLQLVPICFIVFLAAIIGNKRHQHPKVDHAASQLYAFFESGGLVCYGLNGIFSVISAYDCQNTGKEFCWGVAAGNLLTALCSTLSVVLGCYDAVMTRHQPEKMRESVRKILNVFSLFKSHDSVSENSKPPTERTLLASASHIA